MVELIRRLTRQWRREDGQGLVEYALILVFVSIIAIGALGATGEAVRNVLQSVANSLTNP